MKLTLLMLMSLAVIGMVWALPADAQAGGCGCDQAKASGCEKASKSEAKAPCGKADCDCGCKQGEKCNCQKAPRSFASAPAVGAKATCPVMNSEFTVAADSPRSTYQGKHYVFCCASCKPKFDAEPAKFAVR